MKINPQYCYFPTTIMFVDDNQIFLDNIKLLLGNSNPLLFCQNPKKALKEVTELPDFNKFKKKLISSCCNYESEMSFDFDDFDGVCVSHIYEKIYDSQRFAYLSAVLVDYTMPSINGIQFCQSLQSNASKKIMVTGEADLQTAVSAFNDGIINKFILKNTKDILNEIKEAISSQQSVLFQEITDALILDENKIKKSFLFDREFILLFNQVYFNSHCVEYYLLDNSGSYLFLNKKAKPFWLLVKAEKEMQELCKIAKQNQAPTRIINEIQQRRKLPFFLLEQHKKVAVDDWENYLHPCEMLKGANQNYYYALVSGNTLSIDFSKVTSYLSFLENWDKE